LAIHLDLILSRKFYAGVGIGSVEDDVLAVRHIPSGILVLRNAPIARRGLRAAQSAGSGERGPRTGERPPQRSEVLPSAHQSSALQLVATAKQKYLAGEGPRCFERPRMHIGYACAYASLRIVLSHGGSGASRRTCPWGCVDF